MPSNDPQPPSDQLHDDPVRRLEERLDRASASAERLIAEATAPRKPPAAGYEAPSNGEDHRGDLELLSQLISSLREVVPPELERRLADALHEVLLALRALLDYYIERIERTSVPPAEVEDIPIA
jgi:hypothetical protein